ncbi:glycosyltransferase [Desertivirga xinjiangensis]|uniref:glycosyltransferase n=1 Tax=Desertivirga xinjiangensis TaxID=539206 RepID=UPI00210B1D40|nr:glycosyltransferase [Pedobacter xinjiangensis]
MLISVLMSVYDSGQYLENAILSILNQTFENFEFIIIDDGSTDNSVAICQTYASKDSRIRFIQNEQNLGLAASLNKGIQIAKGHYIARQDADDISSVDRLSLQLKYALAHPEVDVIGSDCYVIDITGQIVFLNSSYSRQKNFRSVLLNRRAIFPHGSAFIKRKKLEEVGLYDTRYYYVQDGELWLRFLSNGALVHVLNQPLYLYRTGPVATTRRKVAKDSFNNALRLSYSEHKNIELANLELDQVKVYLTNSKLVQRPNYMAEYWKSLGNAAYFNSWNIRVSYKYIFKAFREKNSINNYLKYLFLVLIYLIPPNIIRPILAIR